MPDLVFDSMPSSQPWRALFPRKPGLGEGEQIPPFSARVQETIATGAKAYRSLCGFTDGSRLPLPFPQVVASPLHLAVLTHPEFPLPAMGLVHVASEIVQHRPIEEAEPMGIHCWVEGQRGARAGVEFDLITEVDSGGQTSWRSVTTILSRAATGQGPSQPKKTEALPEMDPGTEVGWDLPSNLGRRYSRVAGDRNPIHLYPWTAKLFGFKRHIIHGMWLLARAVAELEQDSDSDAMRLEIRFKRPVFLPGSPLFNSAEHKGGRGFVLKDPQRGKPHLEGWFGPV